jgi:hypothetical protein
MSSTPSPVARGKGATHHILKVDRRTSRPSRAELNERRGPHRSPAHGRTFQHDSSPRCERGRRWAGHLAVRNPINDLRLMIGPCSPNQYPLDPNDELPGDIGAAFAVNVGIAMSEAKARAAISVFMTHLHIWTVGPRLCICAVTDRPALAWRKMVPRAPTRCDGDHIFRSIQSDSDVMLHSGRGGRRVGRNASDLTGKRGFSRSIKSYDCQHLAPVPHGSIWRASPPPRMCSGKIRAAPLAAKRLLAHRHS